MRTALVLTHVAFEDLGSLEAELLQAGFYIDMVDACTADFPALAAHEPDLLVVLGGPIGVYEQEAYPFIAEEIAMIRARLADRRPTLGICLGAQLMAAALRASVHPGTQGKELGWFPLTAGADVAAHDWFAPLLAPGLKVLHWHGDTFSLPEGATQLAATDRYPNQAFALGEHALALQFHPEVTVRGLERWYVGHACELASAGIDVAQLRADSYRYGPALEHVARQLWRDWLARVFQSQDAT
ncbi:glutamine amidotransferase [Uliginosibacterium sp. H3]|uniref:Glutamine amidotransferase n=1 Tax=Uliginosibacterium silvisoli TaxID=3114758 RepID=A0ABU6JZZ7_9RHOO|nr:glutamine amidotransferase [Uliginosibacterium sp. H3]